MSIEIAIKEEVRKMVRDLMPSAYDPVFGLSKEQMMERLGIKSETTFYDRLRKGKIVSKEVGGSNRYFLP